MFAAPAQTAAGRQLHLQHRRGIGEDAVPQRADGLPDLLGECLQPRAHDFVVIPAPRVERDHGLLGLLQALQLGVHPIRRCVRRQIVHAGGQHADSTGHQFGRTGAAGAVALHVIHLAMKARLQPGEQTGLRVRQIHAGHTDIRKPQRRSPLPDVLQQALALRKRAVVNWRYLRAHATHCRKQLPSVNPESPSPATDAVAANHTLLWSSEADTQAFAARLADALQTVCGDALIALHGDLGAGKTTLVRHILRALGVSGRVKSPTYAVVESYALPAFAVWHLDFYRFNDPHEFEDAGLRDLFASPGLKLVEWPDKAQGYLPDADWQLYLRSTGDSSRTVTLQTPSARGAQLWSACASP